MGQCCSDQRVESNEDKPVSFSYDKISGNSHEQKQKENLDKDLYIDIAQLQNRQNNRELS